MADRILLTGATGLVGSWIMYRLLQDGAFVRALYRDRENIKQVYRVFEYMSERENAGVAADATHGAFRTDTPVDRRGSSFDDFADRVEWVEAGLDDVEAIAGAMEGIDRIFHAAALVSFKASDNRRMMESNPGGTATMIDMALESGIKDFVYVSSVASLPRVHNSCVDETFHEEWLKFSSMYSESKFRAEMEVWRGSAEGLRVLIVNPGIIIGPCDFSRKNSSSSIIKGIYNGLKFYPTGGNAFVDVRDVAFKTVQLASDESRYGERYILISENLPYRDVLNWAAGALNVSRPEIKSGLWMGYAGFAMDKIRTFISRGEPKLTAGLIYTTSRNFFYSNEKVKGILNEPFIPVKQSLEDSAELFLKQLKVDRNPKVGRNTIESTGK